MPENVTKKTVLVTGASSGIGSELSRLFAQDGYNLVLTARSEDKLYALKAELEEKYNIFIKVIVKDLGFPNAPVELYEEIKKEKIRINVLVNNAGFAVYGDFLETSTADEMEMLQVNVSALTYFTKVYAKEMSENGGGKILNVASLAAFQPGPLMAVYYASKAYVLHFSEAIHSEFKKYNIIVSALCPGPTKTNFQFRAQVQDTPLFIKGRGMDAETVAKIGYNGLKQGKTVIIPGFNNKILSIGSKFFPHKLTAGFVKNLHQPKA
ncbi:MAG TPA: SDR family oxidoreductase [Ignavibacteriaceae bacterium]|nr:SDR family oxidoreductase [Ignavibacteriaceae bacterium]